MSATTVPATIGTQTAVAVLTVADQAAIHDYALAEKSAATRRAYRSDFAAFTAWCAGRALNPIPAAPETVAAFIADQATDTCGLAPGAPRSAAVRLNSGRLGRNAGPSRRAPVPPGCAQTDPEVLSHGLVHIPAQRR